MTLRDRLASILPGERIKTRLIDLVTYASDAGFYYLRPQAVVLPENEKEIVALFNFSHEHRIPMTFRTGGTSLSGQSITDGILVDLSRYWNNIRIETEGEKVRVQPGITGSIVNAHLKKYRRKIGPDPSSIDSAMMGGILSNNSSGMCCGVRLNSYHTTAHIRFILPNGLSFSTENAGDYQRFEKECPHICQTLLQLRQEIMGTPALYDRIREKYTTKNTVGYSLNALADHAHPLDMMARLLIGAEGTLGFIAEAVMHTIPDHPCKSTALLYFRDIYAACNAIGPLSESGAQAVELMDRASLRSIENIKGVPERLRTLPPDAAALLVEYHGDTTAALQQQIDLFLPAIPSLSLLDEVRFTEDPAEQAFLWKLRKGMFPAVGAVRASGTTVILEDIAFPVRRLGDAILQLQALFAKHGYDKAIIFGHAKDGNIHFVVTQSFNIPTEIQRYDYFMQDVVDLVVKKFDGTLKAEHGTGRNMAPFVETEWGGEAYRIMRTLKQAIDPDHLLNPGVIINEDPQAHIRHLKAMPAVEAEVDKCIECGYCEHVCPSRNITLTPRRRIVLRRQLEIARSQGDRQTYKELSKQYNYDGLSTCAVDGMCATACPVDINTGDLVKRLRRENHNAFSNRMALLIARNFAITARMVRGALVAGGMVNSLFGPSAMTRLTAGIKRLIPSFPLWGRHLHAQKKRLFPKKTTTSINPGDNSPAIVYFPTCISRVIGEGKEKKTIVETFFSLSWKAGINVIIPPGIGGACCGQIFSSKGFGKAHAFTCNNTVDMLWQATREGSIPVVLDISSCTYTLLHSRSVLTDENKLRFDSLKIIDSIDYLHDHILPSVKVRAKKHNIVLHPVCSLEKMQLKRKFTAIAANCAGEVDIPMHAGCCGMAGDRGFLFPELTAAATAPEATEVKQKRYDGYYSSARTCEMALSDATGASYESLLYLVDECI